MEKELRISDFEDAVFEWGAPPYLIETEEQEEMLFELWDNAGEREILTPDDKDFEDYAMWLDFVDDVKPRKIYIGAPGFNEERYAFVLRVDNPYNPYYDTDK